VTDRDNPDHVLLTFDGPIAQISFNRPARRNALSPDLLTLLRDHLTRVAASDARVLILRGEGQDFCVGADMYDQPDQEIPFHHDELMSFYHTGTMLHEMSAVTIAAIDGGCAGPGMAWAAACDFRFASLRAVFNTAFLAVGVAGEMGLAWTLSRILGSGRARELLFFPEKMNATKAEQIGFVTRTFDTSESLYAGALEAARQLAARDPLSLKVAKANILAAENLTLRDFVEVEGGRHILLASRGARTAAFSAYAAKHKME
jgi:2-(1,2-epoxy-1,2-dihydrophenyl)acetyl-CoA isomerase